MFDPKELMNVLVNGQTRTGADRSGGAVSGAIAEAKSSDLGRRAGEVLHQGATVAGQVATQAGTAISGAVAHAQEQLRGTQAGAALDRAKQVAGDNPLATGAVLGGLATILLGTQTGRAVTGSAAKLGGLALLGGLAYKAFKNYQEGKPLTAGIPGLQNIERAPAGSGFTHEDHSSDSARLMVRAMIAAAAADGVVEPTERQKVLDRMQEAGLGAAAAQFLNDELAHPASAAEIAAGVGGSRELATQVYAAAVFGADAQSEPEKAFLSSLARALKLDDGLVAHIGGAMEHPASTTR